MIISSIFDPIIIKTSLGSAIVFAVWFTFWYKFNLARTEREKAYVCTLLSSFITSAFSLPLVYTLLCNGGNLSEILVYRTWTVLATTFFMTFLVMDLSIGVIFYRSKIELLTGWIHHITYLGTLTWAIYNHYCGVFIMMCVLEIPTFLLALGSVRKELRRDWLFASTFFLTRILFHAYSIKSAHSLKPFGPVMNALAAFFPLHCFWFYGFIKQQARLMNKTVTPPPSTNDVVARTNKVTVKSVPSSLNSTTETTIHKRGIRKIFKNRSLFIQQQSPPVSVH